MNICLIAIYVEEFNKLKQEMEPAQIRSFISGIEETLKKTLRRSGDVVIKDTGEVAVILTDCDKMAASKIQGRLEEAMYEYLGQMGLEERIKLSFGMVSYPDDAANYDDLLKKVKIG